MQFDTEISARENLSGEIAALLRMAILTGDLKPGERVNELRLAGELGVSRAPLREALNSLRKEGGLIAIPRRGFFVAPLSKEEVMDIYPIRAYLDPEALRLSGLPSKEKLGRLGRLNDQLAKARRAEKAIALDDAWCFELWDDCPNRVLVGLIEQFMWRTRRYELASMGQAENVKRTAASRREIMGMLARGDLEGACARLRKSLTDGAKPVLAWLDAREREQAKSVRTISA